MLRETGFEIIKVEEQSFDHEIIEDDLIKLQWPVISSRPISQISPPICNATSF